MVILILSLFQHACTICSNRYFRPSPGTLFLIYFPKNPNPIYKYVYLSLSCSCCFIRTILTNIQWNDHFNYGCSRRRIAVCVAWLAQAVLVTINTFACSVKTGWESVCSGGVLQSSWYIFRRPLIYPCTRPSPRLLLVQGHTHSNTLPTVFHCFYHSQFSVYNVYKQ